MFLRINTNSRLLISLTLTIGLVLFIWVKPAQSSTTLYDSIGPCASFSCTSESQAMSDITNYYEGQGYCNVSANPSGAWSFVYEGPDPRYIPSAYSVYRIEERLIALEYGYDTLQADGVTYVCEGTTDSLLVTTHPVHKKALDRILGPGNLFFCVGVETIHHSLRQRTRGIYWD